MMTGVGMPKGRASITSKKLSEKPETLVEFVNQTDNPLMTVMVASVTTNGIILR